MMKFPALKIWILTISCCVWQFSFAQDCSEALYEANSLFEQGKFNEAISKIEPCVSKGLNKNEQFEAYKLLAKSYINVNDLDKAKSFVIKMLKAQPDYQLFPNNDPAELRALIDQFVVRPKLYIGAFAGISQNSVRLQQSYSILNVPQGYHSTMGFQYGLLADYRIKPLWSLNLNLAQNGVTIFHEMKPEDNWRKEYIEQLRFVSTSLGINRDFPLAFHYSLSVGALAGFSSINSSRIIVTTYNSFSNNREIETKDGLSDKVKTQAFAGFNIGISKQLLRGTLSINYTFSNYFNSLVLEEKRFDNMEFILNSGYVNDDISLRSSAFYLSYKLPVLRRIENR